MYRREIGRRNWRSKDYIRTVEDEYLVMDRNEKEEGSACNEQWRRNDFIHGAYSSVFMTMEGVPFFVA